jgi:hypothetical protein
VNPVVRMARTNQPIPKTSVRVMNLYRNLNPARLFGPVLLFLFILSGFTFAGVSYDWDGTGLGVFDAYIYEHVPAFTYNISNIYVGLGVASGDEYRGFITACGSTYCIDDSINTRIYDTALLILDIASVSGTWTTADSLYIYALRPRTDTLLDVNYQAVTWNTYDGAISWGAVGAKSSDSDYHPTPLSKVSCNGITSSDSMTFNIVMAFDSGWIPNNGYTDVAASGFLILWPMLTSNSKYIRFVNSEALSGNKPRFHFNYRSACGVVGCDQAVAGKFGFNETARDTCSNKTSGIFSSSQIRGYKYKMYTSMGIVTQAKVRLCQNTTGTGDSLWAYIADPVSSAILEISDPIIQEPLSANCSTMTFIFDSATVIDANDTFVVGPICRIDGSTPHAMACSWTGATTKSQQCGLLANSTWPPTSISGITWNQYVRLMPCMTVYISMPDYKGQSLIIGSCESEETPYYWAEGREWMSVPDHDLIWNGVQP